MPAHIPFIILIQHAPPCFTKNGKYSRRKKNLMPKLILNETGT